MKALAAVCDLVPGWLYALVVLVLTVLLVLTKLQASTAQVESAQAGQVLSTMVATSATVAASSVERARDKGSRMSDEQAKDVYELNQTTADPAARSAELVRGMRDEARAASRASRECVRAAASAASGGDEGGGAGLRSLVEPDSLVLDGQAQSELAQLIVSARITGETLKTGRKALERCTSAND